jgi:hypothetical protein
MADVKFEEAYLGDGLYARFRRLSDHPPRAAGTWRSLGRLRTCGICFAGRICEFDLASTIDLRPPETLDPRPSSRRDRGGRRNHGT